MAVWDYMVSYAREDEELATEVAGIVRELGHQCFIDTENLDHSGQNSHNIERAIASSESLIAIITPASRGEDWVQSELHEANKRNKKIIFLTTEKNQPPMPYQHHRYFDITEQHGAKLHSALLRIIGAKNVALPRQDALDAQLMEHAKRPKVQIIGWTGVQTNGLYKELEEDMSLSFLTTESSMETLPRFSYVDVANAKSSSERTQVGARQDGTPFHVVYVDYEFCERYATQKKIESIFRLTAVRQAVFNHVDSFVQHVIHIGKNGADLLSAPVQFGFQEPLIRTLSSTETDFRAYKTKKDYSRNWGHEDFDIINILENYNDVEILLWHWYMPTLTQMFLTYYFSHRNQSCTSKTLKDAFSALEFQGEDTNLMQGFSAYLADVLAAIEKHRAKVRLCVDMDDARWLLTSDVRRMDSIMLGVGSGVLVNKSKREGNYADVTPVIPRQGIPVWINSAAKVVNTQEYMVERVIANWMNQEVQLKMFAEMNGYVGLPTRNEALSSVMREFGNVHAVKTLASLKKRIEKGDDIDTVAHHRVFPRKMWGKWITYWEELTSTMRTI